MPLLGSVTVSVSMARRSSASCRPRLSGAPSGSPLPPTRWRRRPGWAPPARGRWRSEGVLQLDLASHRGEGGAQPRGESGAGLSSGHYGRRIVSSAMKIYTKKGDDGTTGGCSMGGGSRRTTSAPRSTGRSTRRSPPSARNARRAGRRCRGCDRHPDPLSEMFVVGAQLATSSENQPRLQEGVSKVTSR